MTKKQLIKTANSLGIPYSDECENSICLKGIGNKYSILYSDIGAEVFNKNRAVMIDFSLHLREVGRDSLKIQLKNLLDTTENLLK